MKAAISTTIITLACNCTPPCLLSADRAPCISKQDGALRDALLVLVKGQVHASIVCARDQILDGTGRLLDVTELDPVVLQEIKRHLIGDFE